MCVIDVICVMPECLSITIPNSCGAMGCNPFHVPANRNFNKPNLFLTSYRPQYQELVYLSRVCMSLSDCTHALDSAHSGELQTDILFR